MNFLNPGEIVGLSRAALATAVGILTTCLILSWSQAMAQEKYTVHKTEWYLQNNPKTAESGGADGMLQSLDLLPLVDEAFTAESIKFTVTLPEKVEIDKPFKIQIKAEAKIIANPVQQYLEDSDPANDKLTKIENVGLVVDTLWLRHVLDALPSEPGYLPVGEHTLSGSVEVDASLNSIYVRLGASDDPNNPYRF